MPDLPERSDLTVDQHRMVAPSRVWLMPPPGDPTWYAGSWKSNPLTVVVGDVPYVPESRLREVEAELVAMKLQVQFAHELAEDKVEAMREQLAALRADLKALVKVDGEVPLCVHCGEHRTRCPGGC